MNPPIKMKLKSRGIIPYGGGFKILDPLTGIRVEAVTWDHLITKVQEERRANGAPIGLELEDEVEQWCCIAHPDEVAVVDERLPKRRALNLDDVVRGTQVILAFKLAGSPLVSQAESERRAAICIRCPMNLMWFQSCSICNNIDNVVRGVIGQTKTAYDQQLFSCNICGCSLKAAVHLPNDILNRANDAEMNRAFEVAAQAFNCWHNPSGLDGPST